MVFRGYENITIAFGLIPGPSPEATGFTMMQRLQEEKGAGKIFCFRAL
jgi:hypothetical protein